jgi:lysophospholipase L1-like esterase
MSSTMTFKPPVEMTFIKACFSTIFAMLLFLTTGANATNISAFGDSITKGDGSNSGGYPPKLSNLLNADGKPATVANFGKGGENTWYGSQRFDSVLAAFPANFILIMEGTNDIVVGLSVESTRHNLQAMINKAKAANVAPLLSTLTPSTRSGSLVPQVWNPMIKTLASSNGIPLVDNYAATAPTWGSLQSGDGLHPNDRGYQVIANTWFTTLAPIISSASKPTTSSISEIYSTGETTSSNSDISSTAQATSSSSEKGGGGGCSPIEPHVILLKQFRDRCLQTHDLGRKFVNTYYRFSPPVADFIRQHDGLKPLVQIALYPLIGLSYLILKLSLPVQIVLCGMIVILFAGSILVTRKGLYNKNRPTIG